MGLKCLNRYVKSIRPCRMVVHLIDVGEIGVFELFVSLVMRFVESVSFSFVLNEKCLAISSWNGDYNKGILCGISFL